MSVFYDHLVKLETVRPHLFRYLNNEDEVAEVLDQLDQSLHHVVLEVIFTELPPHAHEGFILRFRENPASPHHLPFLRQYAPHIEERIRLASEQSKQKFLDAIHA